MQPLVFLFGNNREGQAGISHCDETISRPTVFPETFTTSDICRAVMSQKQTLIYKNDGSILSCGENDANELGRSGKRSLLQRIDALEAFQVTDVCVGEGFVIVVEKDGRAISWGLNPLGQLGNGTRENKEKPRIGVVISDGILQISAGAQHCVCISRSGDVFTWGGNRKGQLGDGQLTSSCTPQLLHQLKHRPVTVVSCGESHTLALTVGGNVYAWGDNSRY